jgi:hypothetical protein
MSVFNLAGMVSYEVGAIIMHWLGITETNFDSLWLLVLITNFSTLLPLPFLNWLPSDDEETETSVLLPDSANSQVPNLVPE